MPLTSYICTQNRAGSFSKCCLKTPLETTSQPYPPIELQWSLKKELKISYTDITFSYKRNYLHKCGFVKRLICYLKTKFTFSHPPYITWLILWGGGSRLFFLPMLKLFETFDANSDKQVTWVYTSKQPEQHRTYVVRSIFLFISTIWW